MPELSGNPGRTTVHLPLQNQPPAEPRSDADVQNFAVALGGALLGYVIPLASALTQTHSVPEFVAWALLAGVIQVVTFWLVRRIALPDISARIERGEMSTALYVLFISLAVGILNAACMTA